MFIHSGIVKNMGTGVRLIGGKFTAPLSLSFPILK